MATPQNFRSAFNGFNREDVAHYLEYINSKHQSQVNQLTAEIDELRARLEQKPSEDQSELVCSLQEQCVVLNSQLEEALAAKEKLEARCAALEQQLAESKPEPAAEAAPAPSVSEELEAYRRAERAERVAKERAELIYSQTNSVLSEASARVNNAAAQLVGVSDQVSAQLDRLRGALTDSRQALRDATETMNRLRPGQ